MAFIPALIPPHFSERSTPIDLALAHPLALEFAPFTRGFDLLGDESLLAIELPGHALGQMGLLVRSQSGEIYFFVADAAWLSPSIQLDQPPHPITNLLFSQPQQYRSTLHRLHIFQQNRPDIHIIPSHCAATVAACQSALAAPRP